MNKFVKSLAVAASLMLAPIAASAASLLEGGADNLLAPGEAYSNAVLVGAGGADSDIYTLKVMTTAVDLSGSAVTLEFVGHFTGLKVFLGGNEVFGSVLSATSVGYTLATVITSGNPQDILIKWTGVTGSGAGYLLQVNTAAVPLPAAGLLLLTAVGGLAVRRRKSRAA